MKKIVASLLLVLIAAAAVAQSARVIDRVTIADGDSIRLMDLYERAYATSILPQELAMSEKYYTEAVTEPVLRSLGSDRDTNLRDELNAFFKWGYCSPWVSGLYRHLRGTVRINSAVRRVVANIILRAITDLCNFYPKDYKQSLLDLFASIRRTLVDMPNHEYQVTPEGLQDDGEIYYFIVDNKDEYDPYTFEAAVMRRVLIDKIPREEILGYLDEAIAAAQKARPKDESLYRAIFNGRFSYVKTISDNDYFLFTNGSRIACPHPYLHLFFYKEDSYLVKTYNRSTLFNGNGKVVYDIEK